MDAPILKELEEGRVEEKEKERDRSEKQGTIKPPVAQMAGGIIVCKT